MEELIRECDTLNDAARCIADIEKLDLKSLTLEVSVSFAIAEEGPSLPDYVYRGKRGLFVIRWPTA